MEVCSIAIAVKEYQTLIAGVCTILAATVAFIAVLRPAKHTTRMERRATAAALWAELAGVGSRLFADVQNMHDERLERIFQPYKPSPLHLAIFEAAPQAVGRLPSDDAFTIVAVYKLLIDLNERYATYRSSKDIVDTAGESGVELETRAESLMRQVGVVLRGTYRTAGLPRAKANAALKAWTSTIPWWKW